MPFRPSSNAGSKCTGAVAPVDPTGPLTVTYAEGEGTTATALITQASGTRAINTDVFVDNSSCYPATVVVSYLDGADCDACTPDTVTIVDRTFSLPGNTIWEMPANAGLYVSAIQVQLDANVPVGGQPATITAGGIGTAECPTCIKLVP